MLAFLKDHPFAVNAYFDSSVVLTFAILKEELASLLPECLELDTFQDKWAFIAIAMVAAKELRPAGLPKFLGNNFFLIGYRVFVKYYSSEGKRLRGLYILKSATDKKKMELLGNIFTHYNYSTIDLTQSTKGIQTTISSQTADFNVVYEESADPIPLPPNSPFSTWKEARRFAGPLPFTFTYKQEKKEVLIIEGVRQNWTPNPINIVDYKESFINSLPINQAVLANAFIIKNIPYSWKKGRTDQWKN